jgi:hypothetical protein
MEFMGKKEFYKAESQNTDWTDLTDQTDTSSPRVRRIIPENEYQNQRASAAAV